MQAQTVGRAGLRGWRSTLAGAVAPSVAKRTGLSEEQVRALVGAMFLILSVLYVVKSAKEIAAAFSSDS